MGVLSYLRKQRGAFVACPNCEGEFRLADSILFDAMSEKLPQQAADYLERRKHELADMRKELARRQQAAITRPRVVAEAVNIGKVVEKIAPSLPGFPVVASDCRALFEPIDYIVFRGLSTHGTIDSLVFVDVKSGRNRLTGVQSQVRNLVECGKVNLVIAERSEEV